AQASNLEVVNVDFYGINNGAGTPGLGSAVHAFHGTSLLPTAELQVGGDNPNEDCRFIGCYVGVEAEGAAKVTVKSNYFLDVQDRGVYLHDNPSAELLVASNEMKNYPTGIHYETNELSKTTIEHNDLEGNLAGATAILAQEISPLNSGSVTMRHNTITEVDNGILMDNLFGANTVYNDITMRAVTAPQIGVRMQGCEAGDVDVNTITGSSKDPDKWGIFAYLSPTSRIRCNTIDNHGYGQLLYGAMTNSEVAGNTMIETAYGIFQGANNIGPQGSSGAPSDNQWLGSPPVATLFAYYSPGVSSPWYCRTVSPYQPTPNISLPTAGIWPLQTPAATGPSYTCPPSGLRLAAETPEMDPKEMEILASGDFEFGRYDDSQYALSGLQMHRERLLWAARGRALPTLSKRMDRADLITLAEIESLAKAGDFATARALNAQLQARDLVVQNLQQVYAVTFTHQLTGTPISAAQRSALEPIARQCP
ncbi:MAG: right-handed parallel beta-helix repeat-containing protein, partial [Bacteroidota bacterium]